MEQPPSPRRWFTIIRDVSRLASLRLRLQKPRSIRLSIVYVRS